MKKPPILFGGFSENLNFGALLGRTRGFRDSGRLFDFGSFELDRSKLWQLFKAARIIGL